MQSLVYTTDFGRGMRFELNLYGRNFSDGISVITF
jgi:hypothetical protein